MSLDLKNSCVLISAVKRDNGWSGKVEQYGRKTFSLKIAAFHQFPSGPAHFSSVNKILMSLDLLLLRKDVTSEKFLNIMFTKMK